MRKLHHMYRFLKNLKKNFALAPKKNYSCICINKFIKKKLYFVIYVYKYVCTYVHSQWCFVRIVSIEFFQILHILRVRSLKCARQQLHVSTADVRSRRTLLIR